MSKLTFEGDLDGVNERQLEFIRSVLEKRGYKEETVLFEAVGKVRDNHAAIVKRLTVIKDGVTLKMIAKISPGKPIYELAGNTRAEFRNEHYMYTHVLPKFKDMLQAAGVPDEDTLKYAACYGTNMEETNEVILLEDMTLSDFEMLDQFKSLGNDTVKLVLKNFAIYHSASFALKKQEPETYEKFCKNLINVLFLFIGDEDKKTLFVKCEEDVISILDNDKYKKMVNGSLSELGKHYVKINDIDNKSEYSVIQHGDAWSKNIMFAMEGDEAVKCCVIDYQTANVGSPVGDIQRMIMDCTDYETRSQHYHDWIDYYHSELERSLANFGLKINYVYPRDKLDDDMKRYTQFSLCISVLTCSIRVIETSDADGMKKTVETESNRSDVIEETKVSMFDEKSILKHKTMIEGIMDSFVEWGYLPAK